MLCILYFDTKHYLLTKYGEDDKNLVVVKNPITGIPLQTIDGIQVPGIEKIVADLIVDKELFAFYRGRHQEGIVENAFEFLSMSRDKLFRYDLFLRKWEPRLCTKVRIRINILIILFTVLNNNMLFLLI